LLDHMNLRKPFYRRNIEGEKRLFGYSRGGAQLKGVLVAQQGRTQVAIEDGAAGIPVKVAFEGKALLEDDHIRAFISNAEFAIGFEGGPSAGQRESAVFFGRLHEALIVVKRRCDLLEGSTEILLFDRSLQRFDREGECNF